MEKLQIYGDVSGELDGHNYTGDLDYPGFVLLEAPEGGEAGAWVIDRFHGVLFSLEGLAAHRGEPTEELRDQLREVGTGDSGAGTGDGGTASGAAGDIGLSMVPTDELEADLDQGTTRKTVRNLDQGALAAIREVTGAESDAEAVREAVALVKNSLVKD